MELIDTHTHLDAKDFDDDREEVIQRALDAGVKKIITVGASDGYNSAERAIALAEKYDFIWATAGIHPHDAETPVDLPRLSRRTGSSGQDLESCRLRRRCRS